MDLAERLATAAAALAVLRQKSVVVRGAELYEALKDVARAYGVDPHGAEVYGYIEEWLEKYRVYAGESQDDDIYVFVDYSKVKKAADAEFVAGIGDIRVIRRAYERYLHRELSACELAWSSALAALRLAERAGFKVEYRERLEEDGTGAVKYTVVAPTGEAFGIRELIGYCGGCHPVHVVKCGEYRWERRSAPRREKKDRR
jgi:hypothetical protein